MPVELHAEHLVRLPLVPVGSRPHRCQAGEPGGVAGHMGPQQRGTPVRLRPDVRDHREAGLTVVVRRQPVEELRRGARVVADREGCLEPALRGNLDGDDAERLVHNCRVADERPKLGRCHAGSPSLS
jgi:hypothetical protein